MTRPTYDLSDIGYIPEEAFVAFMENNGATADDPFPYHNDLDDAVEDFTDHFYGEWDSVVEYAENYVEETGMLDGLPENLRYYFDVQAFARDLVLGGDIYTLPTPDGFGVFVFSGY